MSTIKSSEAKEKPSISLDVDVQGLPEFLDAFSQMEAAVDKLCDKLERMNVISRRLRKTFNITHNYHLTLFNDPDEEVSANRSISSDS